MMRVLVRKLLSVRGWSLAGKLVATLTVDTALTPWVWLSLKMTRDSEKVEQILALQNRVRLRALGWMYPRFRA
jgi:hypothetical protein